ncbi:hypothetical protein [Leptothoe sp. PORK10 BA2]|uniref:hypothetical protein n=1 Tax=Leptothoe sp. PORK10 BA2 TaxID=3110254 RepID=UPI002B1F55CD|nr:hypothetical protein [Leptothoe sp. PORK10 BA2]MEA5466836.1 hypothetical protein [Leptothoe sp. PORK10 BA2]
MFLLQVSDVGLWGTVVYDTAQVDAMLLDSDRSIVGSKPMRRPKQLIASQVVAPLPSSQNATGKLKYFRPLPYHVTLSQAARLEAWTQDVDEVGSVSEAEDSGDFDPRLMEW